MKVQAVTDPIVRIFVINEMTKVEAATLLFSFLKHPIH